MRTFFFSATKGSRKNTLLASNHSCYNEFIFKENNKDSLPQVYNKAIDFAIQENFDFLVLCHDDVIIESDLTYKIPSLMEEFDVIGVAGTTECKLEQPALWHIMGGGFQSGKLHGAVAHGNDKHKAMTYFGPYPHRVLLLDGVFLCISKKAFTQVRFDETNPAGFHFYDLDYSLSCHKAGLKLGVSDIMITHASPGLREFTDEFNEGQKWFLEKWKGKL
jgi:GT2 family glycosyltransferase